MPTDKDFHFWETYLASVLSYTDNAVLNTVLDSLKSVSRMITFLIKLKNENYLTQNVYVNRSYSYKRHI